MEITGKTSSKKRDRISYDTAFSINGKIPPQNTELEAAVLGALMLDQNALNNAIEQLRDEYFYKPEHQLIFAAIRRLFENSQQVDILTVVERLTKEGNLQAAGGAYYVSELTSHVASAAHIEYHARILTEKYIQRELIRVSTETLTEAYDETTDVITLLDKTEQRLMDINDNNFRSEYRTMESVVHEAMEVIQNAQGQESELTGLTTGFIELDRITAGFHPGTLIILAARPAMGKTSFALSIARNMAVDFKIPVAFFTLEMTAVELTMRLISSESGIPGDKLKKGDNLSNYEKEQLLVRTQALADAPLFIDETSALTIFELRAKCRRMKIQHNIKMIFIDYLQLMQGATEKSGTGNREQEISYISRQLKALSKELQVPILALSQLSRAVETRGGARIPVLSDLRESGAIEQDADIVTFIHRPEYYGQEVDEAGNSTKGIANIIIAKHRSGSTGTVRLRFIHEYARFDNLDSIGGVDGSYGSAMGANTQFDSAVGGGSQIFESKINDDSIENEDMF